VVVLATTRRLLKQEVGITRLTKLSIYSLTATGIIVCGAVFLNQVIFAKELASLHIVPRPEGVTELYFINYRKPPASLRPGAVQDVAFMVRNHEHKTTRYHYQLVGKAQSGNEQLWAEGAFTLADNSSKATRQTITMPDTPGRMAVEVDLDYAGTTAGSDRPSPQKQSIRYWVDIAGEGTRP
jgi:hypothetical protein